MTKLFTTKLLPAFEFLRKQELLSAMKFLLLVTMCNNLSSDYMLLGQRIYSLWSHSGSKFVVLYLKECLLICYKWLAQDPYKTDPLGGVSVHLSRFGLPGMIPINLQLELLAGSLMHIKLMLTIFSLYRVISFKSLGSVNSITDPFNGISPSLVGEECYRMYMMLINMMGYIPSIRKFSISPTQLFTSGPNFRPSMGGLLFDSMALWRNPLLVVAFTLLCVSLPGGLMILLMFLMSSILYLIFFPFLMSKPSYRVGKLSEKVEAAGKVSLFAITDWFSQTVLHIFHIFLISILKLIPQDGTFDQLGPARKLLAEDHSVYYSFDLKSATDRLPVACQIQILSMFTGSWLAFLWGQLMTKRVWWYKGKEYVYAVGQPMGAYSSWPMMALTHHFIVQIAALSVGYSTWFADYAILGDDMVIANQAVADQYLVMMSGLGVQMSLQKTLKSSSCLEFAKCLLTPDTNWSPFGASIWIQALRGWKFIPAFLLDMVTKGFSYPSPQSIMVLSENLVSWYKNKGLESNLWLSLIGPYGAITHSFTNLSEMLKLWNEASVFNNPMMQPFHLIEYYSSAWLHRAMEVHSANSMKALDLFWTITTDLYGFFFPYYGKAAWAVAFLYRDIPFLFTWVKDSITDSLVTESPSLSRFEFPDHMRAGEMLKPSDWLPDGVLMNQPHMVNATMSHKVTLAKLQDLSFVLMDYQFSLESGLLNSFSHSNAEMYMYGTAHYGLPALM